MAGKDAGGGLAISVLGPLSVTIAGRPVAVPTGRLRALLVRLALSPGTVLSVDRLTEAVWDDRLPGDPRRSLHTYINRLRVMLGPDRIATGPDGYLLCIEPGDVDAVAFGRLVGTAAEAADPDVVRATLAEAMRLWRGEPFDGVRSGWLERTQAPRLTELFLSAVERSVALDVESGRFAEVVPWLSELAARHPLRESLWLRLLQALGGCGRQAEALQRYDEIRRRLAEELGADPGPALQKCYAGLLGSGTGPGVPRQLPADVSGFAGRRAELAAVDDLAAGDSAGHATTIIAITGTAGVGKTALAVHAAHRLAEKFSGGQLYVNLRGFDPVRPPTPPARALRGFLDALGIASAQVPSDSEAQAGLYRSLLADRRMLVVLDNARDAEQVRLLLPGGGGCLVMITSRDQLAGVVAARGAHPVVLGLLDTEEARALMTRRLGPDRVAAEPEPVAEIINRCHGLPLALAIVAARAVTNRAFPLAALAGQLSVCGELDAFANGDASTDMRAVFSWSYRALGADAARVFRLLGLLAGPDYTAQAMVSIAALPLREARAYLAELARAHLITEQVPGRFVMHDLLHAYAGEVALTEEDEPQRRDAVRRMLDHYLRTGYTAAMLIYPRDPITLVSPLPGVVPEELADHQQALAWFAAEHPVLLAAVDHAAAAGFDVHTWQLAWTLYSFLDWRGHWPDQAASQRSALQAAVRLHDQVAQARTHINLAQAYGRLRHYPETHRHLRRAVELYTRLGDKIGQARAHLNLCHVLTWEGNHVRALEHGLLALDLHRAADHRSGEAEALNEVGWCHAMLGQYELTIQYCSEALPLMEETGHRHAVAATWDSLGYAHHHLGEADRAIDCYERTLRLYQDLGDRFRQAETLARLGDAYHALADTAAAVQAWRESVEIFEKLDHQDAHEVRAKLKDVTCS